VFSDLQVTTRVETHKPTADRKIDMSRTSLTALAATVLLAATGCTSNRIVGHRLTQVGSWFGELGITGHLNEITIQAPSRMTKLSIIGDANKIVIEDRSTLAKIEIWGENNTISIPQHLVVRVNQWGKGNQIIRRPTEAQPAAEEPPTETTAQAPAPPVAVEDEPAAEPADAEGIPE
jgi:hypothetical protein